MVPTGVVLVTSTSVSAQTRTGNLAVMSDETAALDLSTCDIVYVVRAEEQNEDLRYSLRSLANVPHKKVFISGYVPSWCTDIVPVPRDQEAQSNQENSNLNLLAAVNLDELSDDFIFMNDDFFIMQPSDVIPLFHQGLLSDVISRYKSNNRMGQAWSLIATRDELMRLRPGKELLSYELHMPMLMNKHKVRRMFEYWPRPVMALRPRSFYGNVYGENGVLTEDAKTTSRHKGQFISTVYGESGDDAHELIRATFSTPSAYESRAD